MRGLFSSVPVEYGTVSGSFPDTTGNVSFTFIPSVNVVRSTRDGGFRITPEPVTCSLSPEGNLVDEYDNTSVKLLACGVGFVPQEWFWTVTSNLPGWRAFSFVLSPGENVALQSPSDVSGGDGGVHAGGGECCAENEAEILRLNKLARFTLNRSYWDFVPTLPEPQADDNAGEVEGLIVGDYMIPLKNYTGPWFELGVSRVEIGGQAVELPENTSVGGNSSNPDSFNSSSPFGLIDNSLHSSLSRGGVSYMHLTSDAGKAVPVPDSWNQGTVAKFVPKVYESGKQLERDTPFVNGVVTSMVESPDAVGESGVAHAYKITATMRLPEEVDSRFTITPIVNISRSRQLVKADGTVLTNPYSYGGEPWRVDSFTNTSGRDYEIVLTVGSNSELTDVKFLTAPASLVVDKGAVVSSAQGVRATGSLYATRASSGSGRRMFVCADREAQVLADAGDLVLTYDNKKFALNSVRLNNIGVVFDVNFSNSGLAERIPNGAEVVLMRADEATGIPDAE